MNKPVITIARQYGSGGRTIGEMLANRLNIHFYDKELSKVASDESGVNEAMFVNMDERITAGQFFSFNKKAYNGQVANPGSEDFISDDNLFNLQAKAIRTIAERESCVIMQTMFWQITLMYSVSLFMRPMISAWSRQQRSTACLPRNWRNTLQKLTASVPDITNITPVTNGPTPETMTCVWIVLNLVLNAA